MNHDSSIFRKRGVLSRASVDGDALSQTNGTSQKSSDTHAPARNWAWAHTTDSYDWMDRHGPFWRSGSSE
jgi:hypothetical protein